MSLCARTKGEEIPYFRIKIVHHIAAYTTNVIKFGLNEADCKNSYEFQSNTF